VPTRKRSEVGGLDVKLIEVLELRKLVLPLEEEASLMYQQ